MRTTLSRAVGGLALVLVVGCGRHGKEAPKGGSDIPPSQVKLKRNVELAPVEVRPLDYVVETVGYLEAEGQTELAAGVSGIVDEVLFREGQWVEPNTILVKIDQERFQNAVRLAEANVRRAEADAMKKEELARIDRNAKTGVSPRDLAVSVGDANVARAELENARAALINAQHHLRLSQVRSRYAGQINKRLVAAGSHLKEETVIGTIADVSKIRLVGWVPEKAAGTVLDLMARQRAGRSALLAGSAIASRTPWTALAGVVADDAEGSPMDLKLEFNVLPFPERVFKGRVFYLSTVASPDTHMFECKAEVNGSGLGVDLKPGLTAQIRVPLRSNPRAIVVPEESVRASERGFIAFVPKQRLGKDGKEEWFADERELTLGFRTPGWVEVLKGVRAGEYVVRKGAEALEKGTPIQFPAGQGPKK